MRLPAIFGNTLGELGTHRKLRESGRAVPGGSEMGDTTASEKTLTPCVLAKQPCHISMETWLLGASSEWQRHSKSRMEHLPIKKKKKITCPPPQLPVSGSLCPLGCPSVFLLYFLPPGSPPRHLPVSCFQRGSSWVALFEVSFLKQTDSKKSN